MIQENTKKRVRNSLRPGVQTWFPVGEQVLGLSGASNVHERKRTTDRDPEGPGEGDFFWVCRESPGHHFDPKAPAS